METFPGDVPTDLPAAETSSEPRKCSNTGRCKQPILPPGWKFKLCRACQVAKNATNKRNRQLKNELAAKGEDTNLRKRKRTSAAGSPAAASPDDALNLPTTAQAIDPSLSDAAYDSALFPSMTTSFTMVQPTTLAVNQLIFDLGLQAHPEGGFFHESDRSPKTLENAYNDGKSRSLHTTIYYALSRDSPNSFFHRHKADSIHLLHSGRARFTVISPPLTPQGPPRLTYHTLGNNFAAGERLQLKINGSCWRFIELLPDDLASLPIGGEDQVGMLMSEVCVPGFAFEDHELMNLTTLNTLLHASVDPKTLEALRKYIKPPVDTVKSMQSYLASS